MIITRNGHKYILLPLKMLPEERIGYCYGCAFEPTRFSSSSCPGNKICIDIKAKPYTREYFRHFYPYVLSINKKVTIL